MFIIIINFIILFSITLPICNTIAELYEVEVYPTW